MLMFCLEDGGLGPLGPRWLRYCMTSDYQSVGKRDHMLLRLLMMMRMTLTSQRWSRRTADVQSLSLTLSDSNCRTPSPPDTARPQLHCAFQSQKNHIINM